MKYDVHLFAVTRVKIADIEASSQQDAIKQSMGIAHQNGAIYKLLKHGNTEMDGHPVESEYAEEVVSMVVDEHGDEDFDRTRTYDQHGQMLVQDGYQPYIIKETGQTIVLPTIMSDTMVEAELKSAIPGFGDVERIDIEGAVFRVTCSGYNAPITLDLDRNFVRG